MKEKRSGGYSTRQCAAIYDYVKGLGDRHFTAAELVVHFRENNSLIGRTTVYRCLEKLEKSGALRKYTLDGVKAACYQYVPMPDECAEHFHLKCEECGSVIHLDCDLINEVHRHISAEHDFIVNGTKSVIYGKCTNCVKGASLHE